MELKQRSIPLRVTLGQIVVHRYYVNTFTHKGIEIGREGCHKGFAFTGGHFGNFTRVKYNPTNELHIIMHHVPLHLGARCKPFVRPLGNLSCYLDMRLGGGQLFVEHGGLHY